MLEDNVNIAVFFDLDGVWYNPKNNWIVRNIRIGTIGSLHTLNEVLLNLIYIRAQKEPFNLENYYIVPKMLWEKYSTSNNEKINITPAKHLNEQIRFHLLKQHDIFLISQVNCKELLNYINLPKNKINKNLNNSKFFHIEEDETYNSKYELFQNKLLSSNFNKNIKEKTNLELKNENTETKNIINDNTNLSYREKFDLNLPKNKVALRNKLYKEMFENKETISPFEKINFIQYPKLDSDKILNITYEEMILEKINFLINILRKKNFKKENYNNQIKFHHYDQIFLYYTQKEYLKFIPDLLKNNVSNLNTQRKTVIIPSFIVDAE